MTLITKLSAIVAASAALSMWDPAPAGAEDSESETTIEVSTADQRPATAGPPDTFTGEVSVQPLYDPNGVRTVGSAEVTFSPSARTAWHTHPGGQTLNVTSGEGWVQQWGAPKQLIKAGDVVWIPPAVKHWHGATSTSPMSHIASQDFVDGSPVEWMELVADEQYLS
jgi:quercetin dioxygenase-like cupin family protein